MSSKMRVGVICEGQTDFVAIEAFFRSSLSSLNIVSEFVAVQPTMDNTLPKAGWGNVLLWLNNNPPTTRIAKYFGGGLFGGDLNFTPLDCLLIQLDTDILENESFQNYVREQYNWNTATPAESSERAQQIISVLRLAWREQDLTVADKNRHIPAPAVESTEAWCIAAFNAQPVNCEDLSGQLLVDKFMSALEISEGRPPTLPYAKINKDTNRRRRFCEMHEKSADRISAGCVQFEQTLRLLQNFG